MSYVKVREFSSGPGAIARVDGASPLRRRMRQMRARQSAARDRVLAGYTFGPGGGLAGDFMRGLGAVQQGGADPDDQGMRGGGGHHPGHGYGSGGQHGGGGTGPDYAPGGGGRGQAGGGPHPRPPGTRGRGAGAFGIMAPRPGGSSMDSPQPDYPQYPPGGDGGGGGVVMPGGMVGGGGPVAGGGGGSGAGTDGGGGGGGTPGGRSGGSLIAGGGAGIFTGGPGGGGGGGADGGDGGGGQVVAPEPEAVEPADSKAKKLLIYAGIGLAAYLLFFRKREASEP